MYISLSLYLSLSLYIYIYITLLTSIFAEVAPNRWLTPGGP